jgi:hypothetical protein
MKYENAIKTFEKAAKDCYFAKRLAPTLGEKVRFQRAQKRLEAMSREARMLIFDVEDAERGKAAA